MRPFTATSTGSGREPNFRVLIGGGAFYESPRWRDGRWWVSDLYRRRVVAVDDRTGAVEVVLEHDDDLGGLGWLPDGSLLVVAMTRRRILRCYPDGTGEIHADLAGQSNSPLNDMVTDAEGWAWVGNYGFDLDGGEAIGPGSLFAVPPAGGGATVVADDVVFPNGGVLSADGTRLIVGETFAGRYSSWAIGAAGSLSDRQVWARFGEVPPGASALDAVLALDIVPDGCALDAEGCLWVADVKGARCVRVAPGGEVLTQIAVPAGSCFACALGGPEGRTLAMCVAPGSGRNHRIAKRDAMVIATDVDVPFAAAARS